jgi:hypothetical protein
VFPAVFVGVVSALILAFNIYNPYAFTIIISLGIIWMYLAYLGVTIPLLQRRLAGWPDNASSNRPGLFSLGGLGVITNVIAIVYGAAMAVNLSWPRDYYYGPKFYQQYGPILGVAAVVIVGLVLYYGYQQTRMEVLPEHRADQNVPLSVAMGEPPPIHGGP